MCENSATSHGNLKAAPGEVLKCWETCFEEHLNTNWPKSEVALDDIPDDITGLVGPPFSIEVVQKAVKGMKSRKASDGKGK